MRHLIAGLRLLLLLVFIPAALSAAPPAVAELGPPPQGRLDDSVRPLAYRIDLTVLPENARFSGHVEIDVELARPTRALWINGRGLHVTRAIARSGALEASARYTEVDRLGLARIDLSTPLPAGRATLLFDYDAPFSAAPAALYRTQVAGDWYVWSQFESIDARGAFPSFDQPGFKTPFTVSVKTKRGLVVASNAPELSVTREGAFERHRFAATRPLPTYLVAFAVGPFAVASGAVPPTPQRPAPLPLRVIATKPNAARLAYALAETPRIVTLLERYFDLPFPFPKLDQIASPEMPGAMENAGADIYADNLLLLDAGASTAQRQDFGMVVAHELSHQWFGDLVTPAWWDDIWLNESFANWMGFRIGDEWRPELNIGVGAIDDALSAMDLDALAAGRPIHQPITRSGEIDSAFDAVTYGKGGQVVAMIAAYLGDEKFRDGVRLHLRRHAYGNATSEDFFASLAEAAHDPRVIAAMRSFVDQQGVPVVRVTRSAEGGFKVTQKRYALLGSRVVPERWIIPLCIRIGATRQCDLLDKPEGEIAYRGPSSGAVPIMPNAGGKGYYRFALDDADWQALIAEGPKLEAGEALAVSDSLWAGFRAGEVAPARLIEAVRAFALNPDSNAAVDGGRRLAGLRQRGLIAGAALPAYRALIASVYGPKLAALGDDPRAGAYAGDGPDRQKLRAALVALVAEEARDPAIRRRLDRAARAYLSGDTRAVDQAMLSTALAVRVELGGLPAAQALAAKLAASSDDVFRDAARDALGRSGNPAIARWLLALFDDPGVRATDKSTMLALLMVEPATRDIGYDWYAAHFDRLAKDAGIFGFGALMSLPGRYCSIAQSHAIARTLTPLAERYQRGQLELARTIEQVHACGALSEAQGGALAAALEAR